jgi:hypothetical protein
MVLVLWLFPDDGVAKNSIWTDCSDERKLKSGAVVWYSSPELNTKTLDSPPIFLSITYTALSDQRFRSYGILRINKTAQNYSCRTAVGRNQNLGD